MKLKTFLSSVVCALALLLPSVSNALEKGDKILVAYFSQTGNTERLAEDLVKGLSDYDVTLTKIINVDPYPEKMEELVSRAATEKEKGELPEIAISNYIHDIHDFDAVLLGTPIWHDHAPMPVLSFLNKYPLTDANKLAVFITSGTSEPTNILSDIESAAKQPIAVFMHYRPGIESGMVRGERYSNFIDEVSEL